MIPDHFTRRAMVALWLSIILLIAVLGWTLKSAFDITAAVNKPWQGLGIGEEPSVMELETAIEWTRMRIWWQWVAFATATSLVVLSSLYVSFCVRRKFLPQAAFPRR